MPDSPENRKDYPDILRRLSSIEQKVNGGLADQFKDLKENQNAIWKRHDEEAKESRLNARESCMRIEVKVDKLTEAFNRLPCGSHTEKIANLNSTRNFQGMLLIACFVAFLSGLVGYGYLNALVANNKNILEKIVHYEQGN